jgi:hypothetical protein
MAVSPYTGEHHHGHGNTPAAWLAVILAFLGFLVGGVGFPLQSLPLVIVGAVLIVASPIVGKALQVMGFGQRPAVAGSPVASSPAATEPVASVESTEPARQTA